MEKVDACKKAQGLINIMKSDSNGKSGSKIHDAAIEHSRKLLREQFPDDETVVDEESADVFCALLIDTRKQWADDLAVRREWMPPLPFGANSVEHVADLCAKAYGKSLALESIDAAMNIAAKYDID